MAAILSVANQAVHMQADTIDASQIDAQTGEVLRLVKFVTVCHDTFRLCGLVFSTAPKTVTFHGVNLGANLWLLNSPTRLRLATAFELTLLSCRSGTGDER
jgi:hypothetical protein